MSCSVVYSQLWTLNCGISLVVYKRINLYNNNDVYMDEYFSIFVMFVGKNNNNCMRLFYIVRARWSMELSVFVWMVLFSILKQNESE